MLSRRDFIGAMGASLAATTMNACAQTGDRTLYAFVGSITAGGWGTGGGGGVSVHTVDLADGSLTQVSHTGPEFDNVAAGYLRLSPNGRHLYAVNETKSIAGEAIPGGRVSSFAIDPGDGSLAFVNTQPSMGSNPAYVAMDATGSWLLCANHTTPDYSVGVVRREGRYEVEQRFDQASVAMFPIQADGSLGYPSDVAVLPQLDQPLRGEGPHAHCVNIDPGNRIAVVCDKGSDRLHSYKLDLDQGALTDGKYFATRPGAVPRHNAFHPTLPYLFVIYEEAPILSSFRYDGDSGDLELVNTMSTVPENFDGIARPADVQVHPDGRFVFGSNREHDSIAIFEIDQASGEIGIVDIVPSGGHRPRCLRVDPTGNMLFAGNRGSDSVVSFHIDRQSGKLEPTGARSEVPRPACINFLWL